MWDNSTPGNGSRIQWAFVRDGLPPTFTVSKSQSNIGNTQARQITVSAGGTISDANGIAEAVLSVRQAADSACPTAVEDVLNLPARRVTGNKRDLSNDGSKSITFDETFTVMAPSQGDVDGDGPFVTENLCFFLNVEDIATDEIDADGNKAAYDVGSFSVNWANPGPVHRLGAVEWDATGDTATTTPLDDDNELTVTEGAADGTSFAVTLTTTSQATVVVSLSGPATVNISPLRSRSLPVPWCRRRSR